MTTGETWLEKVAAEKTFREIEVSAMATRMLQRTTTNRIILQGKQSTILIALRLLANRMSSCNFGIKQASASNHNQAGAAWQWLSEFADLVEDYQLTLGQPKNARDQFLAALKHELQAEDTRKQGGFLGRH